MPCDRLSCITVVRILCGLRHRGHFVPDPWVTLFGCSGKQTSFHSWLISDEAGNLARQARSLACYVDFRTAALPTADITTKLAVDAHRTRSADRPDDRCGNEQQRNCSSPQYRAGHRKDACTPPPWEAEPAAPWPSSRLDARAPRQAVTSSFRPCPSKSSVCSA
jgi:hypothetical protein